MHSQNIILPVAKGRNSFKLLSNKLTKKDAISPLLPPHRTPSNTEKLPVGGRLALLQALKVAKAQKQAI